MGTDWEKLGYNTKDFNRIVEREFRFLIEDYGFRLVDVEPIVMRYESSNAVVEIWCDPRLGEFDIIFNLKDSEERSIDLVAVLEYLEKPGLQGYMAYSTQAKEVLIPKIAALVQDNARPALRGDSDFIQRVRNKPKSPPKPRRLP